MLDSLHRFARLLLALLAPLALFSVLLGGAGNVRAAEEFLDPAIAFRFEARMLDAQTAEVRYRIADGYYMYRERFAFRANGVKLGTPQIPPGKVKFDETFQKDVETYKGELVIRIPVEGGGPFTLTAQSQGCADAGLCYPPQEHSAQLAAGSGTAAPALPIGANAAAMSTAPAVDMAPATPVQAATAAQPS
ncbi:MAG: protein-disulfide reductase DsbD, partial [Massilia sp.]